ncbi:hypothetical protein DFJ73DRAFT_851446 [Zopfochytrium polystomum]|nr:hypothetical protein DFJ73DRAFT_851446 [Zopfochytrium polystomum]
MPDKLAIDILSAIANQLPTARDRCNLSATCRDLRDALAPSVFRCVRATNLDRDRAAIAALVSAHGPHFRHVRFQCMLHGNPVSNDNEAEGASFPTEGERLDDRDDTGESDPRRDATAGGEDFATSDGSISIATDILSGRLAPNMDALALEFIADHNFEPEGCKWVDDEYGLGGSIYISIESEDEEGAAAAEEKFEWRRVMAHTWRAVSSNARVRSLTLRSLPPNITTTWCKPEWPSFLRQLEHLSIQMWGGDNGAGWCSITTKGYQFFLAMHLPEYFFSHADSLVSFDFVSSDYGVYGGDNQAKGAPFALPATSMPRLRRLRLQDCFFDAALLDFLQAHSSTLEAIHLIEFMAAVTVWGSQKNITWAGLFDGIAKSEPRVLTDFKLTMRNIQIADMAEPYQRLSLEEIETLTRIERKIAEDGTFPLFYYGSLDDKYGFVCKAAHEILESFVKGDDLASYKRLMEIVRINRQPLNI